jgi:hypothetical protein
MLSKTVSKSVSAVKRNRRTNHCIHLKDKSRLDMDTTCNHHDYYVHSQRVCITPSTGSFHSHGMNNFSTTRAAQQKITATR